MGSRAEAAAPAGRADTSPVSQQSDGQECTESARVGRGREVERMRSPQSRLLREQQTGYLLKRVSEQTGWGMMAAWDRPCKPQREEVVAETVQRPRGACWREDAGAVEAQEPADMVEAL